MKEFRSPTRARPFGLTASLMVASVTCLLAGALAAGTLGGVPGLGVGGAGFAAYLFLFARAFRLGTTGPRHADPGVSLAGSR